MKMKKTIMHHLVLLLAWCLALMPMQVQAHPHVFIDARFELFFDKQKRLAAVRHAWQFGEAYTAFALQGRDTNHNGRIDAKELQALADINIDTLWDSRYFTFVNGAKSGIKYKKPTEYWLTFEGGILTLYFTLPLESPLMMDKRKVSVEVYDPTYFVAFKLVSKKPVEMINAPKTCSLAIKDSAKAQEQAKKDLSESFFEALGAEDNFGVQFSNRAQVTCQ